MLLPSETPQTAIRIDTMNRFAPLAALVPLLLSSPALAQMVTPTAQELAEVFCVGVTGNDDAIVRATLTPELLAAIEAAEAENAVLQQAAPDEKPPLGDGIPWAAYPDQPSSCFVTWAGEAEGGTTVDVTYGYADTPDQYTDHLLMKRSGEFLRIDNIEYANEGNLRDVLASVFNF
jgi:hypothetical protein